MRSADPTIASCNTSWGISFRVADETETYPATSYKAVSLLNATISDGTDGRETVGSGLQLEPPADIIEQFMSPFEIVISSNAFEPPHLLEVLKRAASAYTIEAELELRRPGRLRSGLEQTVVVAIVAGTSAAISALISGVLRLIEIQYNRTAKIVIRGADGTTVEVPFGIKPEELERLAEVAKSLNRPEMKLVVLPEKLRQD